MAALVAVVRSERLSSAPPVIRFVLQISIAAVVLTASLAAAPLRWVEDLDRGLVGIKRDDRSVFLSWRHFGTEPEGVRFHVERMARGGEWRRVTRFPLEVTCYLDEGFDAGIDQAWAVTPVLDGREAPRSAAFIVHADDPPRPYLKLPIEAPDGGRTRDGRSYRYHANDLSVGDLDGDGDFEYILRWEPSNSWGGGRGGETGPVVIDAYDLDKGRLWRINLGININASAHITQMTVYDLDGDGCSEVVLLTADGTVDGGGGVIGKLGADHRNRGGTVLSGVEYLSVFDGRSGKELATVPFVPQRHPDTETPSPRQIAEIWGDDYGNRVNRFGACVAYLDGERPSLVTTRGYYHGRGGNPGRTCIAAWNWRGGRLEPLWTFDTLGDPELRDYIGQGNHQVSVADLDGDGRDEIVYGACAIDDDGSGLYTTRLGHGDALHVGDLDPARPGIEVFTIHEGTGHDAGAEFRAADGTAIWKKHPRSDVGRGVALDIDPRHRGYEFWSTGGQGVFDVSGREVSKRRPRWVNMGIWWDGDLLRELLDGTIIDKWNWREEKEERLLSGYQAPFEAAANNGSKSTPCLVGDVLGDWREELILRAKDDSHLMIFVSTIPTELRLRTLLHDTQYRVALAWQNVGYNQPPHPGVFVGDGMKLPMEPFRVRTVPHRGAAAR